MESRVIQLTSAAHKHGNLNIRSCGKDFFPPDAFGGSSVAKGLGNPITVKVEGFSEPIETDIPTDSKTGKPNNLRGYETFCPKKEKPNFLGHKYGK
jgi:hypothetical protein